MTTKITPKQAREIWAKELRSGKYQQKSEYLRGEGNERCCLGVACDIYAELSGADDAQWMGEAEGAHFHPGGKRKSDGHALPPSVRKFFGLTNENADVPATVDRDDTTLAELNDDGMPFEKIADLIERGEVETKG